MHPELFDRGEPLCGRSQRLFDYHLVTYVRDVEQSKELNSRKGPAIIISASGMADNGRIRPPPRQSLRNPRNCILIVGFQASYTLGRRIEDRASSRSTFSAPRITIRAEVVDIDGYSAHAGRDELRQWVRNLGGPIKRAFCVHGEPEALLAMKTLLEEEGVKEVHVPDHGEKVEIG